ncbi:ABC transporter ATP-binding protein [Pseudaminobacter soli (ex Li et al. 2025)]|uniref:Peptide ABC transporter ATP-binding protein n=1 Tax=Pseudaminobacter soli (ex Li et al. 2025) TaxID=1295366 RepID=A0A2P7SKQ7_9HYPH|nr:dipeptide/oligopeptide/nickel ABC transporter ATP-binding protein [Mesorhizobium soli]PSJ63069.1 peptide ABC transporter ATP-binding protein [Mesorhizobium soli]
MNIAAATFSQDHAGDEALRISNLRVSYSRKGLLTNSSPLVAVDSISLSVAKGEIYAIIGESGSGKTSLLRAAAGLLPASGSVRIDGREVVGASKGELRAIRARFGLMFQDPVGSLSPRLTVQSIITEPFRIHGVSKKDMAAEARRLLKLVSLPEDFAGRYPHQLSGGQARRVGVARALALEPALILADEPTAGLDVSVQGELLNLLRDLQEKLGLAILIITHNLHVVRHIADRIGIVYKGRMIEEGDNDSIFGSPAEDYTKLLLASNLHLKNRVARA